MTTVNVYSCEECGNTFSPKRSRSKQPRFCSRRCAQIANVRAHSYVCLECGKTVHSSMITKAQFCSRPCRKRYAAKIEEAKHIPAPCEMCGTDLYYGHLKGHPTFCSKGCYYTSTYGERICKTCGGTFQHNHAGRWMKHKDFCSQSCRLNIHCELCGIPIYGRNRINGRPIRFCSRECAGLHGSLHRVQKKYKILGYLATLQRLGIIACEECRQTDILTLNVHHKDHNRSNNIMSNLQTLCASCHVKKHRQDSVNTLMDERIALSLYARLETAKQWQHREPEQLLLIA